MNDTPGVIPDNPQDPREVERVSAIRVGQVPNLKKFDSVWYKAGDAWYAVVVERRCAGGVYWARHKTGRLRGSRVVVSAGSYGGAV